MDSCVLQAKGANIGDVYIATEFANHDRRIPIPVRFKLNSLNCSVQSFEHLLLLG